MQDATSKSKRLTLPSHMRLSGERQFMPVYEAKARASVGPLLVYGLPNKLTHPRLGLAVSRRVGNAVTRNAIKRRLREAFRLMQHDVPANHLAISASTSSYDLVISVRGHEPLAASEYREALATAINRLHSIWIKKRNKQPPLPPSQRKSSVGE